ncbi:ClpXP protease specificity-enhancing factor SspB [Alphaproteobacteria bacterium]|nr:ClpXP protease specificity-enhancing factor SspB [Alphaproteobacteria bacterium]
MIEYQKILNKNLLNVFIEILKEVEAKGLDGKNQLYITFGTNSSKTSVPNWLLQKYPNEMTIVIQHEYYHLTVNKKNFSIGLSFNNKKCDLKISFDSIISFVDPSSNFGLNYQFNKTIVENEKTLVKKKKSVKKKKPSNVINFSNYKKN